MQCHECKRLKKTCSARVVSSCRRYIMCYPWLFLVAKKPQQPYLLFRCIQKLIMFCTINSCIWLQSVSVCTAIRVQLVSVSSFVCLWNTPFSVIHMYLVAKVILYYLVLADCKKYPLLLSMSIWLKERISFMLLTVVSDCKRYPPLLFMCIRLQRKKKEYLVAKRKKKKEKKKKQRKDSCYHKYTKG